MFGIDIEKATIKNKNYRKVLETTPQLQLVLMSLIPGEDIPTEIHRGTQFIRIERGSGRARVWDKPGKNATKYTDKILKDGSGLVIKPGHKHYIWNTSKKARFSLYSIYTPAEHRPGLVQRRQPATDT